MSCLSGFLNKTATVYTIDTSESTQSGQPIETLVLRTTLRVFFSPHVRNVWKLYDPGQIKIGEFVAYSVKTVNLSEVLTIDGENYLVESSNPLQVGANRHVYANQIFLSRYKH